MNSTNAVCELTENEIDAVSGGFIVAACAIGMLLLGCYEAGYQYGHDHRDK